MEMVCVVAVMGVLGATGVPALRAMDRARHSAAAWEVERVLVLSRARAMATARPTGVVLSEGGDRLWVVEIASAGAVPSAALDVFGQEPPAMDLSSVYAGAVVESFVNGDGGPLNRVVWFNHRAQPQVRSADGSSPAAFSVDATYTMNSGSVVRVRRHSGAVERD